MDMIASAIGRIESYQKTLDYNWWDKFWASVVGESTDLGILDQSMKYDFSADTVAELSAYAAEIAAAIKSGVEVSEEDMENLQNIVTFLNGLTSQVPAYTSGKALPRDDRSRMGFGCGNRGIRSASSAECCLWQPLRRSVVPLGSNVSAGIGQGAAQTALPEMPERSAPTRPAR